jgi:hypothetical protein
VRQLSSKEKAKMRAEISKAEQRRIKLCVDRLGGITQKIPRVIWMLFLGFILMGSMVVVLFFILIGAGRYSNIRTDKYHQCIGAAIFGFALGLGMIGRGIKAIKENKRYKFILQVKEKLAPIQDELLSLVESSGLLKAGRRVDTSEVNSWLDTHGFSQEEKKLILCNIVPTLINDQRMKELSPGDKRQLRAQLGIKKFTSKDRERIRQQLRQYRQKK